MSIIGVVSASSISSISLETSKLADLETSQQINLKTHFKKIIRSVLVLLKAFKIKPKS